MDSMTYTIEGILSMNQDAAESAYCKLRDELQRDYQHVGGHAARNHARWCAKLRAADSRHLSRAESYEREFDRRCAEYESGTHCKTLLAIWTGRYDEQLWRTKSPCTSSDPAEQADYDCVCAARRSFAGIVQDLAREVQHRLAVEEAAQVRLRQRGRTPSRIHAAALLADHLTVEAAAQAGDYDRLEFERRAKSYGLI